MTELRKEAKEKARQEAQERMAKLRDVMLSSLSEVSKTKGGLNLLRFMYHESGFARPNVAITEKGLDKDALLWNESRRVTYLDIRQFMTPEIIKLVELETQKEEGVKDDGTNQS